MPVLQALNTQIWLLALSSKLPARTHLPLHNEHNFLYVTLATFSSLLIHQIHQFEQVLVAKEAATAGYDYKRILRHRRGPSGRNRGPVPRRIVEVDSVLAPIVAVGHQFESLASVRMMRMSYLEVGISSVTMRCS